MKRVREYALFSVILVIGAIFLSCNKENVLYKDDFEKSYQLWLKFKSRSDDSYQYMVKQNSWNGTSSETVITVIKGKVTQRSFKAITESKDKSSQTEWIEQGEDLNSHNYGAKAITIDEVYEISRNKWLVKRENSKTFFEAKNDGLISLCGYVEDNCTDDCFIGIKIEYIASFNY